MNPKGIQSALAAATAKLFPHYLAWRSGSGFFPGGPPILQQDKAPMRDGVQLATDIYMPQAPAPFPTIVVRTPYSKVDGKLVGDFFARYGYAVVVQDVRGRHASEGDFYPFRGEIDDGYDTIQWISRQPWCNGRIGGFGVSYMGFTEWAMAVGNPALASIAPVFITANLHHGIYWQGVFAKLTFLHWTLTSYGRYGDWRGAQSIQKGYRHFPLIDSDDAALQDIPFYNDWVTHPTPHDYWRNLSVDHRFGEIAVPVFMTAGWYDFFLDQQLNDFQLFREKAPVEVRQKTRILIGPWNHAFFNGHQGRYGIRQRALELIPFEFVKEIKDWYDFTLKKADNGWAKRAPVRLYVLGQNEWRDEMDWPPRGTVAKQYYLTAGHSARSLSGDGSLQEQAVAGSRHEDSFLFDPLDPVPTRGGAHGLPAECGPADQQEVEAREDVLVYSSAPLKKPLLVIGQIKARLQVSSTAPDTDFTAKLVDVFPDGRALIVCEGIVRARYRNGFSQPELLQPGQVAALEIRVGNTAVMFQEGHRIRLEVSSSNAPRYDVNPNTGTDIARESTPVRATQRVFYGGENPSALILPVLPQ
jgi:putative CocE/NonD family hydrolase